MKNRGPIIVIGFGFVLLLCALGLTAYNTAESDHAGRESEQIVQQLEKMPPLYNSEELQGDVPTPPDYVLDPNMEMPEVEINGQFYIGTVKVPSVDIELPVISELTMYRLRIAPCRWLGSIYSHDCIIAAHNYKTHFGPLARVELGDDVYFQDNDGNVFHYTVSALEEIPTKDTRAMIAGATTEWDLTLFTCTLGGRTRVTVRCSLVDE